ncbi:MAG: hypothetical protein OEZ25_05650 [Candidatus Bathyarchaeota archaeon]|nr:hypothetical protein [Candidatus Bathyarchaeota archaeon]
MNKKVALLLVPLLLLPLMSFGYAHFTDKVVKKYKIHVGSVMMEITGVHVDYAKMPDVDNDGVIFGDELLIDTFENPDDCTWYEEITADPVTGGFVLDTTTWIHNNGKLPFTLTWLALWEGPLDDDPCFDAPGPARPMGELPIPPWSWSITVYKWHEGVRSGPYAPTQTDYKPSDYIEVIQHINFEQPDPSIPGQELWQKEWQCKWIRLWVTFIAEDIYEELGSETVGTPGVPS